MDIAETIANYETLVNSIYQAIQSDPDKMGSDKWLRFAIQESDLNLIALSDGHTIRVWGDTYTCQTMSDEFFDFDIDSRDLDI